MTLKEIAKIAIAEAATASRYQEDDLVPTMDYGTTSGALLGWAHRCRRIPKAKLRKLEFPVVPVSKAPFNNHADALEWGKKNVVGSLSPSESGGKGVVTVSVSSLREMLNQRQREKSTSNAVHYAALTKLKDVIRDGVIVESHPDFKKGPDGKRSRKFGINYDVSINVAYTALAFENKPYRVKTTYKRYVMPDSRKAYSYEVSEIEVLPGTLGGGANSTTNPSGKTSLSANIVLKGVADVNGTQLL